MFPFALPERLLSDTWIVDPAVENPSDTVPKGGAPFSYTKLPETELSPVKSGSLPGRGPVAVKV